MTNFNNIDNPTEIAKIFSERMFKYGFKFDFSLKSLEFEIDKLLEKSSNIELKELESLEAELTAYIGETLCRLFKGNWNGKYYGPLNPNGDNFYTCKIIVGENEIFPSHFIGYYLSNGKESEGTFYEYLYSRNQSSGIFSDFLGGGLFNKLKK